MVPLVAYTFTAISATFILFLRFDIGGNRYIHCHLEQYFTFVREPDLAKLLSGKCNTAFDSNAMLHLIQRITKANMPEFVDF